MNSTSNPLPYKWIIQMSKCIVVVELDNSITTKPYNKKIKKYFENNVNILYNFEMVVLIRDAYEDI